MLTIAHRYATPPTAPIPFSLVSKLHSHPPLPTRDIRLDTIADSDRILCVKDGLTEEFDTPINLLNKKGSLFADLTEATGTEQAAYIHALASGKIKLLDNLGAEHVNVEGQPADPSPDPMSTQL